MPDQFEYVIDNDPDLRYTRMLGAGACGSVHEVLHQKIVEADLDLLYPWESGLTLEYKTDGSH